MTGERRRHARRVPEAGEPIAHIRLRTGSELYAVDISDGGVRAHTTSWQRPGARVELHLLTKIGRVLQRARVLRASVVSVRPTRVTYDVVLAFDGVVDASPRVTPTRTAIVSTDVALQLPGDVDVLGVGDTRLGLGAVAPSLERVRV